MIQPLTLGNTQFPINIIQGPLAGISCSPFRYLTWQQSQPAFSSTEMISCKTILHGSQKIIDRYIEKHPQEGPVCFQLSATDPLELSTATKIVTDQGADLIDLNCGCPVKKIRNKGAGSKLLTDPKKLFQLIDSMKQSTHVPVSIKIRVDGDSDEKFNHEIAQVVQDAGADFLVVHGRHWTERYDAPCRYEQIQFFVEALNIPVIGNGDISDAESLRQMFLTGCAGVMIGRAGVGQPWLIKKLMAELKGESFIAPSAKEIGEMLLLHTQGLIDLLESERLAIFAARKFAKYYGRLMRDLNIFISEINQCEGFVDFRRVVLSYFK